MEGEKIEILNNEQVKTGENNEQTKINEAIKLRDFLYALPGKEIEILKKIADIGDELKRKHPDARKCYLFHVMSYSGIDREQCNRLDYTGDDSIVKKLTDLCEQYKTE